MFSRGWAGLATLLWMLLSAKCAWADEPEPQGLSFGFGGVYAIEHFGASFDDSSGVDLRLGWRWNRWVATELRYEWLEGFDSTGPVPGLNVPGLDLSRGGVELDTHQVMLSGKFYPCEGRLQPYATLGLGALIVNTELRAPQFAKPFRIDAGFASRLGAGLDFALSRHWVLNFEGAYLLGTGAVERERYGSIGLGLRYRF